MSLTITLSWPLLAAIVATIAAWIWAFAHPPEHGGMFPDLSPLFYGGVARLFRRARRVGILTLQCVKFTHIYSH